MAMAMNAGCFRNPRSAKRMSLMIEFIKLIYPQITPIVFIEPA
jgi:hypothetical protein